MIEVKQLSDDSLSAKIWEFQITGGFASAGIVLVRYMEGTRKSPRHKFNGDFWDSADERRYHSKLPRPTEIPAWVIDEAVRQMTVTVYIGWTNDASIYAERAVMPAPTVKE